MDITSHLSEWLSLIKQQTTSVGEDVEKREPFPQLVGMQTSASTMENSMEIHQNLKMDLPFDPVIPTLGIYLKKPKTLI